MGGSIWLTTWYLTIAPGSEEKRWWTIFVNYVDVSVVNSWKLRRDVHPSKKMSLLDFRSQVGVKLLNSNKFARASAAVSGHINRFQLNSNLLRSAIPRHFINKIPDNKRRCCQLCHSQTRHLCGLCNVPLHQHCMEPYHKNNQ